MAKRKKLPEGLRQYELNDYKLQQVDVRLRLQDGPAYYSTDPLENPADAAYLLRDIMKDLDREWVIVVNLDAKLRPVNFSVVSIGALSECLAPIQNIMKSAILSNTEEIMLLHSHPSGSTEPSSPDYEITRRLLEACKLMGMTLVDHLIVGSVSGDIYSFRNNNPDMFEGMAPDFTYIDNMLSSSAAVAD